MRVAYVDSSVPLRALLREPAEHVDLSRFDGLVSSALIEIEFARKLDRLRSVLSDDELGDRRSVATEVLSTIVLIEIDPLVMHRARQSFGPPLASLDAIHFASALLWREQNLQDELVLVTHDDELASAGRANGFQVMG